MFRGEIYWGSVAPSEVKGSEQSNRPSDPRAWLIVSNTRVKRAGVVIACPFTTKVKNDPELAMFRLEVTPDMILQMPGDRGQLVPMVLLCEQIRVMAFNRMYDENNHASRLGKLKPAILAEVDARLMTVLDLKG